MPVSSNHIVLLVIIITGIFLMGAVFMILYILLYNQRKKRHLEEKKEMQFTFEKEAVKIELEVQEQTLQSIATEIHDNVGQLLSLSKLTLSTVNIPQAPAEAEQKVSDTVELLGKSIRELRHLASILHAQNILAEGLDKAIGNELNWISRTGRYKIIWTPPTNDFSGKLSPQKELITFRLIQELLNNIIKHADASEIAVSISCADSSIMIHVEDNGKGFDVQKTLHTPKGLGLSNLFKRAGMIEGRLTLTSEQGKGTKVELRLPV